MNKLSLLAVSALILASNSGGADQSQRGILTFQPAQICNSWSYMQGPNNTMGGYVCSGYPMSMQVVDSFSLQTTIQDLEMKLSVLEARVKLLEEKVKP